MATQLKFVRPKKYARLLSSDETKVQISTHNAQKHIFEKLNTSHQQKKNTLFKLSRMEGKAFGLGLVLQSQNLSTLQSMSRPSFPL